MRGEGEGDARGGSWAGRRSRGKEQARQGRVVDREEGTRRATNGMIDAQTGQALGFRVGKPRQNAHVAHVVVLCRNA